MNIKMNIKTIFATVAGVATGIAIMTIAPKSIRDREVAKAKANTKVNAKVAQPKQQFANKIQHSAPVIKLTPQIAKWVVAHPQPKPQTKNRKVAQPQEIKNAHRESLSELSVASLRKLATSRGIPIRQGGRVMNKTQLISRLTA